MYKTFTDDLLKAVSRGEVQYGISENSFGRIATLWSAYLDDIVTPKDVAIMMILFKCARLDYDTKNRDTWIDIAGYAACGYEATNT